MITSSTKKILFLITKSNWGGAQRYVYDLATHLPPDFEVVVVHGGNGVLVEKLAAAGVRTIAIASLQRDISVKKELLALKEIYTVLRNERPLVLHINSSKAGLFGSLSGRICRVPRIIFTAHGWAFNEERPSWQKLLLKLSHYLTLLAAHHTIAVSRGVKKQLRWPGAQTRMTVINPARQGISFLARKDARETLTATTPALKTAMDDPWIGTIAELHPIKQLPLAIAAFAQVVKDYPRLRYIIIGVGEQHATLQTLIRTLDLEKNIFLTGHITEAATLLKAFDYFMLTSQSESFGYVLVEALQAKLPIIATNVGGIPDIITHQQNGLLVESGDKDSLVTALITLLGDDTYAQQLATAAHTHGPEQFRRMVEHTIALYNSANS